MNTKQPTPLTAAPAELLERIARETLGLDTLATRRSDGLDFHDLAVWSIEKALQAAYASGLQAGAGGCRRCSMKTLHQAYDEHQAKARELLARLTVALDGRAAAGSFSKRYHVEGAMSAAFELLPLLAMRITPKGGHVIFIE